MAIPKIGDKLYIETELYIDDGEDDIEGGIATVCKLGKWPGGNDFVCFTEIGDNAEYNLQYIMENQEKWAEKYKGRIAHKRLERR